MFEPLVDFAEVSDSRQDQIDPGIEILKRLFDASTSSGATWPIDFQIKPVHNETPNRLNREACSMQPIGYLKNFFLMAAVVVLSAGCGGGGSDEGAGGDAGFTNNLSGTWTGSVTSAGGTSQPITVGINQPVAGSVASIRHVPLSINGTVSAGGGSFPMTGTKDGNNVTMQFSFGITYTLTGGLSSANSMSGNFTTSSSEVTGGTWLLTR